MLFEHVGGSFNPFYLFDWNKQYGLTGFMKHWSLLFHVRGRECGYRVELDASNKGFINRVRVSRVNCVSMGEVVVKRLQISVAQLKANWNSVESLQRPYSADNLNCQLFVILLLHKCGVTHFRDSASSGLRLMRHFAQTGHDVAVSACPRGDLHVSCTHCNFTASTHK
jgi:hypothetical protein